MSSDAAPPSSLAVGQIGALSQLIADRARHPLTHRARICLFLGAGADIAAGGISFSELKRRALAEVARRPVFDITSPAILDSEFDRLVSGLDPDERALLVESLFRQHRELVPSDSYKLLVLLAEAGGLDAIITTNFDHMLESAQGALGLDVFHVFAPGLARPFGPLSDRFDPPRKPYVKLHGDVLSRSVLTLSSGDIRAPAYDASMLSLVTSIIASHDLVFVGYSGADVALAEIIGNGVRTTNTRVYWCGPHAPAPDAPLVRQLGGRARFIRSSFDEFISEVGRPVLERPSLQALEPTIIRRLFEWRIDYGSREFVLVNGHRAGHSIIHRFARRRHVEDRLADFLASDRPLAIITGPSGFGKTTIGVRLFVRSREDPSTRVLLLSAKAFGDSADFEQRVTEHLGGLGPRAHSSLFRLERWLNRERLRLILFIDAVNEFSTEPERCVALLRGIVRTCYFLAERESSIRVIATMRQEAWSASIPHIDMGQLRAALWSHAPETDAVATIACDAFTDEELEDALARLLASGAATPDVRRLSPARLRQLRDPFLLGALADAAELGGSPIPSAQAYARAFESRLARSGTTLDVGLVRRALAAAAMRCATDPQGRLREIDIRPEEHRTGIVRLAADLHILLPAGDGFLQFEHDRTLEYFFAAGLTLGHDVRLETLVDLRDFLCGFAGNERALSAARLYIGLLPQSRFDLATQALTAPEDRLTSFPEKDREVLFAFAREVVVELAEQGDALAEAYVRDALAGLSAVSDPVAMPRARVLIQAAAAMPDERGVSILAAAVPQLELASTEARIYAVDRVAKRFLLDGCPHIDATRDAPYCALFGDSVERPWVRVSRVLAFASQVGPDNTHPDEYSATLELLEQAISAALRDRPWTPEDLDAITAHVLGDSDRLLFNSTPASIRAFFESGARRTLGDLLERMAMGHAMSREAMRAIEPYARTLATPVEYHFSHALLALSGFNDLHATLAIIESELADAGRHTAPEFIDFLQAALVYLHVLNAIDYDESRFARFEERILNDWTEMLLYRPGLERGERRGFLDPFDRVFEDGFGVVYAYGVLRPGVARRRVRYRDYVRSSRQLADTPLPLYTGALTRFLRAGRVDEALQVLHAMSAVVVGWPIEGLLALSNAIGHHDSRVRRATTRILAEAFIRHPDETMWFIRSSGAPISDAELVSIKVRQDPHVGRRQVAEEEWARVLHFLLHRPDGRTRFVDCLRGVLVATSYEDAVHGICRSLGLAPSDGR